MYVCHIPILLVGWYLLNALGIGLNDLAKPLCLRNLGSDLGFECRLPLAGDAVAQAKTFHISTGIIFAELAMDPRGTRRRLALTGM